MTGGQGWETGKQSPKLLGEPEFSARTGDEEMGETDTLVCKDAGSPLPPAAAAEGRGEGHWGGEGAERPLAGCPLSQPLGFRRSEFGWQRARHLSSPRVRRAAQAGSPGTRQAQAGRPDWGLSQQAASGSRSEADDVFASGSAGAKPGRAGDVTIWSRDHHSNKQLPSPGAPASPRPSPPRREAAYKPVPRGPSSLRRTPGCDRCVWGWKGSRGSSKEA